MHRRARGNQRQSEEIRGNQNVPAPPRAIQNELGAAPFGERLAATLATLATTRVGARSSQRAACDCAMRTL